MKRILGEPEADSVAELDLSLGRFVEEAQVTGQLDHPGIVPVHDIGVDAEDRLYFTMKRVRGEDLRSVFERVHDPADQDWTPNRALTRHAQGLRGDGVCPRKGCAAPRPETGQHHGRQVRRDLCHGLGLARILGEKDRRDLRMRPVTGSFKVAARRATREPAQADTPLVTMDGDVVGTPAYMPPEQALGHLDEMGPWSDVYAAGALLYHLMAGQVPYVEPGDQISPRTLLARVQQGATCPHSSARTRGTGGARGDLRQGNGAEYSRALRQHGRDGIRPARVPGRPGRAGLPDRCNRGAAQVDRSQSGPRGHRGHGPHRHGRSVCLGVVRTGCCSDQ